MGVAPVWIFLAGVFFLFLSHFYGYGYAPYFYLWNIFVICPLFYFLLIEARVFWVLLFVPLLLALAARVFIKNEFGPILFLINVLLIFVVGWCYGEKWRIRLRKSGEGKETQEREIEEISKRVTEKSGNLRLMNRQLEDITNLYELAREFNESMGFEEVAAVMRERISDRLSCQRATLLVFQDATEPPSLVRRYPLIGEDSDPAESKGLEDLTPLEKKVILHTYQERKLTRCENQRELENLCPCLEKVGFPYWIFPLEVEGRLIAVFCVEGGRHEDLPKFEVVSSQLTLQVKKIRLYEVVHELSIVDGLTRVFVRRHFLERFEEELRRAIRHQFPLAVIMLDIDNFKRYNDAFGHLVGDVTLREVAQLIREMVRKVDIISRYGGEEFAIVLPETNQSGALEAAERIRSHVAKKTFKVFDEETKVTVSIGISVFPEQVTVPRSSEFRSDFILELLKKADKALYRAKEEGRNRVELFRD